MYSRILMPTDGSPASQKALGYGLELAHFLGSEVTFLYALPQLSLIPTALGSLVFPPDLERQKATEQVLNQAQKMAAEAGVEAALEGVPGYPVPSILAAARSHDLILMSPGGGERWPMGLVTQEVLQHSPIPVLLVRQARQDAPIPPRSLLLPTDTSEPSQQAVQHGLKLAQRFGARVTFLSVLQNPSTLIPMPPAFVPPEVPPEQAEVLRQSYDHGLEALMKRAQAIGLEAHTQLLRRDDVAEAIVDMAQDYDWVVMGTHGRGWLGRLLIGSVAQKVANHAPKPLLVVPNRPQSRPA
ncbi:universal stress protein [Calidithermus timidus]|jgi:nucleotide-binding universal stress UspA family protein|uniref:universal stress protein n=1 Tax=Calidithermus timidus TaxID=307124 RepID=UPI000377A902|nr:universal stress protein [Calidithermus timidus]